MGQIFLLGDREFRGVHLAAWLTQLKIKYVFRIKGGIWNETNNGQLCLVNELECRAGSRYFHESIKLTKTKGFGYSNLAIYRKRKYRGKQPKEAWYLVTNLDNADGSNVQLCGIAYATQTTASTEFLQRFGGCK